MSCHAQQTSLSLARATSTRRRRRRRRRRRVSPKPSEEEKAGCALMCLFMREGEGARTFDAGRKEGRKGCVTV